MPTPARAHLTDAQLNDRGRLPLRAMLRNPRLLGTEALAGAVTTLALVPEVISFSIIAGVDPINSLIASVVLAITMSFLGGRPAMVSAAAVWVPPGSNALTRMPRGPYSTASAFIRPTIPALLAA